MTEDQKSEPPMSGSSGDEAANRLTALCEHFETYGEWPYNRSDSKDIADLRKVLKERGDLLDRAASATVLPERWRDLLKERDGIRVLLTLAKAQYGLATTRAEEAEAEVERLKARGSHRTLDELAVEQGVGPFDPDAWPAPEDQLSPEEFAAFEAGIAECRGTERRGGEAELAEQMRHRKLGVYRLHWRSGGTSVAAVGMLYDGTRWYAPANWTTGSMEADPAHLIGTDWSRIERADLIEAYRYVREEQRQDGEEGL